MKKLVLFLVLALLASGVAYAEMVEGEVAGVDLAGNKLSIAKADGTSAEILVNDATTYSGEVTALAEVIEGDTVKIDAAKDEASGNWTAKSVEVPAPTEEAPAEEAAPAEQQ